MLWDLPVPAAYLEAVYGIVPGEAYREREGERRAPVIQRQAAESGAADAQHPAVAAALAERGQGAALPAGVRREMEAELGVGLGRVRLHTGAAAAEAAAALGARAFTVGVDIYFGAGAFAIDDAAGRRLLVHELVHVVQGAEGRVSGDGGMAPEVSRPGDALEVEAERRAAEAGAAGAGTGAGANASEGAWREAGEGGTGRAPRILRQQVPEVPLPLPWEPPGKPGRKQPGNLYVGNKVHEAIGAFYEAAHLGEAVFLNHFPIASILAPANLAEHGLTLQPAGLPPTRAELDLRPDICNLTRLHLYEIRPANDAAGALAKAELELSLFQRAGLPLTLGSRFEPGTAGELPAPGGLVVFFAPVDGVIVYVYGRTGRVTVPVTEETVERIRQKLAEMKQRLADLSAGAGAAVAEALAYLVTMAALVGLLALVVAGTLPAWAGAAAAILLVVSGGAPAWAKPRVPNTASLSPEGQRQEPAALATAGAPRPGTEPGEQPHAAEDRPTEPAPLGALLEQLDPGALGRDPARLERAADLAEVVLREVAAHAGDEPAVAELRQRAAELVPQLDAARRRQAARSGHEQTKDDHQTAATPRPPALAAHADEARARKEPGVRGGIPEYEPTAEAPTGAERSFGFRILAGLQPRDRHLRGRYAVHHVHIQVEPEGEPPFIVPVELSIVGESAGMLQLEVAESWFVAERNLGSARGTIYNYPSGGSETSGRTKGKR